MNTNIEHEPKYQLFFKIFKKKYDLHIENNTVSINGSCNLDFTDIQCDKLELPNIHITKELSLVNLNCDELILNNIKATSFTLENITCSSLKFNSYNNTIIEMFSCTDFNEPISNKLKIQPTFVYNNLYNEIIIPSDIHFKRIYIENSNHKWKILDNKFLKELNLYKTNIHNFSNYNSINEIFLQRVNIDESKIKFNNIDSLKKITCYLDNHENKIEKINISNMKNLEYIDVQSNMSSMNLKNLPILNTLNITSINDSENYIDLDKINSTNLSSLTIKGFKIKDLSFLHNNFKIEKLDISSNSPDFLKKESIVILLKDKTFNFYTPYKKSFLDVVDCNYDCEYKRNANNFITLMKSNNLMIKLFYNNLDDITEEDLLLINKEDIKGFKAISYCKTIEALNVILNHKDYHLNNNDLNLLSNETLKSYYQKELIKSKLSTKSTKEEKNNKIIQKKYL